jgi:hypothetical protein
VEQAAVEEGKVTVPRPKPNATTSDGRPAFKGNTLPNHVEALETRIDAKNQAIGRLAENHESCRLGAVAPAMKPSS